uniref:Uncharacterized protein n=1 Tax=Podoviridae sp. ct8Lf7 TaxID=2827723 RepID=A0A8S5S1D1_9CAUD|nr:MAG TPA: hypothetical protein [Podoviridae sp. ct8Lf7]
MYPSPMHNAIKIDFFLNSIYQIIWVIKILSLFVRGSPCLELPTGLSYKYGGVPRFHTVSNNYY